MRQLAISFGGHELVLDLSGAVIWPAQSMVIVADLHFGRALRGARHGGALLPLWEFQETLSRLEVVIERFAPRQILCLGDSFDFKGAELELPEPILMRLLVLQAGRHWVWLTGNHDPAPLSLPGTHRHEWVLHGLALRHIAARAAADMLPEISAHYHPKARLAGMRKPCFLLSEQRLILPAFGSFTGGMDHDRAPLSELVPRGHAVLLGRERLYRMPFS